MARVVSLCTALLLVGVGCGRSRSFAQADRAAYLKSFGVTYWVDVRDKPRPMRLHAVKVDLLHPRVQVGAALSRDPDSEGPAEAELVEPLTLAEGDRALAFINANAFAGLADSEGKRSDTWLVGMPVDISGLAAEGGTIRSRPTKGSCSFWIDGEGRGHVGMSVELDDVREGVGGFGSLLADGEVTPWEGGDLHPRSAVGVDRTGRWLLLVVVDGRQEGFSEGINLRELALYMKDLGCHNAGNLDGGGSSVLILSDPDGTLRTANSPSTKMYGIPVPRPIPAGIAVRRKSPARPAGR